MINAAVCKLKIYEGDPVFDRINDEFNAAQEEGILNLELDIHNLDDEIRLDFMNALQAMGYEVAYVTNEEILEVWVE